MPDTLPKPVRRPRELPARVSVVAWAMLSFIPLASLALCLWLLVRRGVGQFANILMPLGFLVLLVGGCGYVIAERLSRAAWQARAGRACTNCGYDMHSAASGRCPECGSHDAIHQPYRTIFLRLHPALQACIAAAVAACVIAFVVWLNYLPLR